MSERPEMAFCLADYLGEEMQERGWTSADVAARFPEGEDRAMRMLAFELLLACPIDESLKVGDGQFADISVAFGMSEQFLRNLHQAWLNAPAETRQPYEAPDALFAGDGAPVPSC